MKPSLKNQTFKKKVENEVFAEKITDQILIKSDDNGNQSIENRGIQRKHL